MIIPELLNPVAGKYVRLYVCMCVCMSACMYVCMYVCIYRVVGDDGFVRMSFGNYVVEDVNSDTCLTTFRCQSKTIQ
jgi:hypothetical protein